MNTKRIKILFWSVFLLITVVAFANSFLNFKFGLEAIGKIEEQRREHNNFFFKESAIYHNKLSYFFFRVGDIYLYYLSPSVFFSFNTPLIISLISLTVFYYGLFTLLQISSRKLILFLTILNPILPAFLLLEPSLLIFFILQSPILIFSFIKITKKLYGTIFKEKLF